MKRCIYHVVLVGMAGAIAFTGVNVLVPASVEGACTDCTPTPSNSTGKWDLSWHVHDGYEGADSTEINSWNLHGELELATDNTAPGHADFPCPNVDINRIGTLDTGWTYTGGDEFIGNATEMAAVWSAMTNTAVVLGTHYQTYLWSCPNGSGSSNLESLHQSVGGKIALFLSDAEMINASDLGSTANEIELTHVIGHKAGLPDVLADWRIMTPAAIQGCYTGNKGVMRSTVTCAECDKFRNGL